MIQLWLVVDAFIDKMVEPTHGLDGSLNGQCVSQRYKGRSLYTEKRKPSKITGHHGHGVVACRVTSPMWRAQGKCYRIDVRCV